MVLVKPNKIITILIVSIMLMSLGFPAMAASTRTYTLNADFDEGTLVGVEHTTVADQLQLSSQIETLPFIWVPNDQGTISKVDTDTGKELGRYWVSDGTGSPSRTTVDLEGNVWVGNRDRGTVVKVGLSEAGQCIERNGISGIQTSMDSNNDGNIAGTELLPWGDDECVLYEVVLISGNEGTHVPGTYTGPYDTNHWGTSPRGLAIDANNNLWAGTYSNSKYFYINGATGTIDFSKTITTGQNHYGAVVDGNGMLWSAGHSSVLQKINPSTKAVNYIIMPHQVYGLGIDNIGNLFISGWTHQKLSKFDISSNHAGGIIWTKTGEYQARGVAVTPSDNNVWVANTAPNTVTRYDNDGNLLATIGVGNGPTGVAVDNNGKVWVVGIGNDQIKRIDPVTNSIDLTKSIVGAGGHYGYSDMTGIVARSITTQIGTWTVDYDSGAADTPWGTVSWNDYEPAGTSVTVKVRSSNNKISWSGWETATSGGALGPTPDGQYLQVKTTLQITSGQTSPILYDLTVTSGSGPEIPEFPSIALPIIGVLGMMAIMFRGKRRE